MHALGLHKKRYSNTLISIMDGEGSQWHRVLGVQGLSVSVSQCLRSSGALTDKLLATKDSNKGIIIASGVLTPPGCNAMFQSNAKF